MRHPTMDHIISFETAVRTPWLHLKSNAASFGTSKPSQDNVNSLKVPVGGPAMCWLFLLGAVVGVLILCDSEYIVL